MSLANWTTNPGKICWLQMCSCSPPSTHGGAQRCAWHLLETLPGGTLPKGRANQPSTISTRLLSNSLNFSPLPWRSHRQIATSICQRNGALWKPAASIAQSPRLAEVAKDLSVPPLPQQDPQAGCPAPHPGGFGTSPRSPPSSGPGLWHRRAQTCCWGWGDRLCSISARCLRAPLEGAWLNSPPK